MKFSFGIYNELQCVLQTEQMSEYLCGILPPPPPENNSPEIPVDIFATSQSWYCELNCVLLLLDLDVIKVMQSSLQSSLQIGFAHNNYYSLACLLPFYSLIVDKKQIVNIVEGPRLINIVFMRVYV